MSVMKCPICNTPLVHENMSDYWCVRCNTQEQKGLYGSDKLWQELARTRKALDNSEHCCTEWEKQALDYKAENIKLSTALDVAIRRLDQMTWGCDSTDAEHLLKEIKEITALEQKDK